MSTTLTRCSRSSDFFQDRMGDARQSIDYGWPGGATSTSRSRCGTCGAEGLHTVTPHNTAVRLPEHNTPTSETE